MAIGNPFGYVDMSRDDPDRVDKLDRIEHVRELAKALWDVIEDNGGDQRCAALAKTNLEQAAMWANKAVAHG